MGLPIPETLGRQHIPDLAEIAAEKGTTRDSRDGDGLGGAVRHVCFECGGPLALVVVPCRVCGGVGTLSNEQMARMFPDG